MSLFDAFDFKFYQDFNFHLEKDKFEYLLRWLFHTRSIKSKNDIVAYRTLLIPASRYFPTPPHAAFCAVSGALNMCSLIRPSALAVPPILPHAHMASPFTSSGRQRSSEV